MCNDLLADPCGYGLERLRLAQQQPHRCGGQADLLPKTCRFDRTWVTEARRSRE